MDKYSYLSNTDASYVNALYEMYCNAPDSVDISWRRFFEGYDFSLPVLSKNGLAAVAARPKTLTPKEAHVLDLINDYRSKGHLLSKTNPIRPRRNHGVTFDLDKYGLSDADLDVEFSVGAEVSLGKATLRRIIEKLEKVYLGSVGFEYRYIRNERVMDWFIKKCEQDYPAYALTHEEKKTVLSKLNEAVVFENFLHTKFLGQKRFSLEGGENTIPFLQTLINCAANAGVREVVIGMAHRGRLNVMANILGKTYEQIFTEFEGAQSPDLTMGDGDVKYHQGYAGHVETPSGKKVYVKLTPNPSHLEAVNPVVLGYTRAQIDDEYSGDLAKAVPVLIHGDAAVAGQGGVYEVVQMAGLQGYTTGGAIHFVINNQIGFTTDYKDARTSIYCTDVAKIVDAPVLHVNGDDAEAITFCAKLAMEYRQTFGGDVFIDMVCYRKHGHNESDEPKFTQPLLYNFIAKHPNPREMYLKQLAERGDSETQLAGDLDRKFRALLQDRLNEVKQEKLPYKIQKIEQEWHRLRRAAPADFEASPDTSIRIDVVEKVGKALATMPKDFKPLKQVEKLLKDRHTAFFEKKELGWAEAELLAYGSLLLENVMVRMSGQDVRRGTFSHRHAYLTDQESNRAYCNLDHIATGQKKFYIYNSLLSELAVLGFEYGYAMASPNALVIWEAQFGDFANGAQVIIDQFVSSAESKWQRMNGLTMLLPHGYEGQGPEHSSAKMERFLQLAAEHNIVLANPTTAANFFHLLRRQVKWEFRKPCVVFSPKSLLRRHEVVSPLQDFTKGKFHEVIDDASCKLARRLVLCSGKVYYDLAEARQNSGKKDVAIVRIEQLYPFPMGQLSSILQKHKNAALVWAQEEPANMGALAFIRRVMPANRPVSFISRKESASPATGYAKVHAAEQLKIVNDALGISPAKG